MLQIQQHLLGMIKGKLRAAGLNTDLLEDNEGLFNIVNTFYILDKFQDFIDNTDNISKSWAKLLLDIFDNKTFAKRLVSTFAEGDIEDSDVYEEALDKAA